VPIV
jgi:hypothetical protein